MAVVMLVAAVAVLVGVIAVALGRGGELAYFQPDYAPLRLDEVTATDVVLFRPAFSLWGYNVPATDEALSRIADALTERDIEINALRRQVDSLRQAPIRLYRDEPETAGFPEYPEVSSSRDDEDLGRLLSRAREEPSGLGWADPPGPLRFPDDQLSGTRPTGSGFPAPGQAGGYPWSPASRPPAGEPPWPPAAKPPAAKPPAGPAEPAVPPLAFPPATELPRRMPSRGPAMSPPPPAPGSADDPPDFPGRRPSHPPGPPHEDGR